ncbi:MAG: PEPxxWA-CTERM sorting domain-containing protein, partial [Proteobacteria bacterium]|nr:PEPxxWA-CTERM sorting domain-containing protein [Pseudomonadota bacterium]
WRRSVDYGQQYTWAQFSLSAVPEPATWAMMIIGFGVVGSTVRASRRRTALSAA